MRRGDNRIRPEWEESRLPALSAEAGPGDDPVSVSRSDRYFVYDLSSERVDHETDMTISVVVAVDAAHPDTVVSTLAWRADLDGSALVDERHTFRDAGDETEPRERVFELYQDDLHRYWVEARFVRGYAHLDLKSAFRPPQGDGP